MAADHALQELMQRVERLNTRMDEAVRQADAAAGVLPDFAAPAVCPRPELNDAPATGSEVRAIQQFVQQARHELDVAEAAIRAYELNVNARRQHALELLRQRERLVSAWSVIRQHQTAIAELERAIRTLGQGDLLEGLHLTPAPDNRPDPAMLERVEGYLKLITQHMVTLQQRLRQARERVARDGHARTTQGEQVAGHAAVDALNKSVAERRARYQKGLEQAKEQALKAVGWSELPQELQVLFDIALSDDTLRFVPGQIMDWIGTEAARLRDQSRALELMANAPPLRALDPARMQAWLAHLGQLQAVAQGIQIYTPALERTHKAIQQAAVDAIQFEYLKADFTRALGTEFEVYEGAQGEIVALHDSGFWYSTLMETDGGRGTGNAPAIAVVMELFDGNTGTVVGSQMAMNEACEAARQAARPTDHKSIVSGESLAGDVKNVRKKVAPLRKKSMAYAL